MSDGTLHTLNRAWGKDRVFITVRRGDKYLGTEGQTFDLCECWGDDHAIVGNAIVVRTGLMEMGEIPASLLDTHYNSKCRQYRYLMEAMRNAYGVDAMDDSTIVTICTLQRPTLVPSPTPQDDREEAE